MPFGGEGLKGGKKQNGSFEGEPAKGARMWV